ncbi:8524_t:CDS:2, partial [Scutellospora calospora]
TIVGAHDEDVNMGGFISKYGRSHGTGSGVTSKSKYQQDSYLIDDEESYFDDDSYLKDDDDSYLINEDVISLFHIRTGKPALYSHPILLDDGSQEVCCRKNGSNENNK